MIFDEFHADPSEYLSSPDPQESALTLLQKVDS
jgi:hypothetical protein